MIAGSPSGERYDRLWNEAESYFRSGRVEIDPHLGQEIRDRRLGLSVIGRPSAAVRERFTAFLNLVRQVAPKQHFYQDSEFHLTILSLFTATEAFEPYWNKLAAYRAAVDQALRAGQAFAVHYQGVTASKNAVLVQGFTPEPHLDQLRARLRQALQEHGLGHGLDERYVIDTAHTTVLRFSSPPENLPGLLSLLRRNRTTDFGTAIFSELQLVKNDWYMSEDIVDVLTRYPLAETGDLSR